MVFWLIILLVFQVKGDFCFTRPLVLRILFDPVSRFSRVLNSRFDVGCDLLPGMHVLEQSEEGLDAFLTAIQKPRDR